MEENEIMKILSEAVAISKKENRGVFPFIDTEEKIKALIIRVTDEIIGKDIKLQVKTFEQAKLAQAKDWYQNELRKEQRIKRDELVKK